MGQFSLSCPLASARWFPSHSDDLGLEQELIRHFLAARTCLSCWPLASAPWVLILETSGSGVCSWMSDQFGPEHSRALINGLVPLDKPQSDPTVLFQGTLPLQ